jgi:hypothetical protein
MEVLRTAILDFCRRKRGEPFDPSEIVRKLFPEDWALFVEELNVELTKMQLENLIEISQDGKRTALEKIPDGLVTILETVKPK